MSDLIEKILNLINKGKTLNEIATETNLSNKGLYNILALLRNKGINFSRTYYSNGNIKYQQIKNLANDDTRTKELILNYSKSLNALIISDTHIGSELERLDLIKKVYEYALEHDIHIIFNIGDIIDGLNNSSKKYPSNCMDQIDYFLKKYPFDSTILNICILGNHDYKSLENFGINFEQVLNAYRHDFLTLGYKYGSLKVKNDYLILSHPTDINLESTENKKEERSKNLILEGHHHEMSLIETPNTYKIYVPPLCKFTKDSEPSILKMDLTFNDDGYFNQSHFEQLLPENSFKTINRFNLLLDFENKNSKKLSRTLKK